MVGDGHVDVMFIKILENKSQMHYKSVLDGVLDRISLHGRQCGINLHPIPLKIKEIDQEREVIYLICTWIVKHFVLSKSHICKIIPI